MEKTSFTGAGSNDSSFFGAINKARLSPSKSTVPAGATWPFVTLSIDEQSIKFSMMNIKKSVTPSTVKKVHLSKSGYLYFYSQKHDNDFGFLTPRLGALLKALSERGYRLDESSERNMSVARISLLLIWGIPLVFLVVIIVLGILKPNGI